MAKLRLPPPTSQTTGEPSFRWRRISFFLIVGLCFLQLPAMAFLPSIPDTAVNRLIVEGTFDLVGWAFLVYAAGAGAQDIAAIVTTRSARPYSPEFNPGPPASPTNMTVVNPPQPVGGASDPSNPPPIDPSKRD